MQIEEVLSKIYEKITGNPVPAQETPSEMNREERVAAGWSYSSIGCSYLDMGKFGKRFDNLLRIR